MRSDHSRFHNRLLRPSSSDSSSHLGSSFTHSYRASSSFQGSNIIVDCLQMDFNYSWGQNQVPYPIQCSLLHPSSLGPSCPEHHHPSVAAGSHQNLRSLHFHNITNLVILEGKRNRCLPGPHPHHRLSSISLQRYLVY
jgi:hypothetical protein